MFKQLFARWFEDDLLKQSLAEIEEMIEKAKKMYQLVIDKLIEHKNPSEDIYALDRQMNQHEISIRKKVLEHLSINPRQDLIASLIITNNIIDLERIGDFAKNLFELSEMYAENFEEAKYSPPLVEISNRILELFEKTKAGLCEYDKEKAREVMQAHFQIAKECDKIIKDIFTDREIKAQQAVVDVLCSRYLKRISAHLMNISSAVVNPYDHIGFREERGKEGE
jgi:phosphate uptake regulator